MSKEITVAGGNLYQVAVQEYGNAMGWVQIAIANGLKDPQLSGVVTLTIPAFDNNAKGVWNG